MGRWKRRPEETPEIEKEVLANWMILRTSLTTLPVGSDLVRFVLKEYLKTFPDASDVIATTKEMTAPGRKPLEKIRIFLKLRGNQPTTTADIAAGTGLSLDSVSGACNRYRHTYFEWVARGVWKLKPGI